MINLNQDVKRFWGGREKKKKSIENSYKHNRY